MKEISLRNNEIQGVNDVAVSIYNFCANVTPAIYKKKAEEDILAEVESIKLLCTNIAPEVLEEMCKLSVKHFPMKKATNPKLVFDFNYIMEFYCVAFKNVFGKKKPNCILMKRIEVFDNFIETEWEDPETGEIEVTKELRIKEA